MIKVIGSLGQPLKRKQKIYRWICRTNKQLARRFNTEADGPELNAGKWRTNVLIQWRLMENMGTNAGKWGPMGANGSQWRLIGINGSKQKLTGTKRCQWGRWGANGSMEASGSQWRLMGINGGQWEPMGANVETTSFIMLSIFCWVNGGQ